MDIKMYIVGDKYLIPELQKKAGESFRNKVDALCEDESTWNWSSESERWISEAIEITYGELLDTDWPRWYLVQKLYKSRAGLLQQAWFKYLLQNHQPFNEDFINEMAWESKIWKWRKDCKDWDRQARLYKKGLYLCKLLRCSAETCRHIRRLFEDECVLTWV